MIRRRGDKGNFVGLYLEQKQYDIVVQVAKSLKLSKSDLIRMSIARDIEPIYQQMLMGDRVNNEQQN